MSEFLVLIAANDSNNLSPSEEEKCMTDYGLWAQELGAKHLLGKRLDLTPGKLLKRDKNPTTDGPFVEAKELIVGIVLLEAENIEEATKMANSCPLREYFHLYVKDVLT